MDIDQTLNSSVSNLADDEKDLQDIRESLSQHKYLTNPPGTPLDEVLGNLSNLESENELLDVFSSPDLSNKEISRSEVTSGALLDIIMAIRTKSRSENENNNVSDS